MPSPVHMQEPSSFHTALCGVLGRLGRPEAGTEEEGEEEEEEVAHFAQGHTCVRILWQAGLKDLCCSQSLFRGLPKPLLPGNWIQAPLSLPGREETCFRLGDALNSKMATHGTV